jgi:hypothetical protein
MNVPYSTFLGKMVRREINDEMLRSAQPAELALIEKFTCEGKLIAYPARPHAITPLSMIMLLKQKLS